MNTLLLVNDFFAPMMDLLAAYEMPDPGLSERWGTNLYNIALVVVGLGFVIFVHELGHFLAAKTFGVKCDKFYVGFDVPIRIGPIRLPAKLIHFKWGETEYGVGAIPLGPSRAFRALRSRALRTATAPTACSSSLSSTSPAA